MSEYHLEKERYAELCHFCRQYDSYMREGKKDKAELIASTASEAAENEVIAHYLLNAVRWGLTYETLGVPMGRRQFYELRRKFFYLLDRKRG